MPSQGEVKLLQSLNRHIRWTRGKEENIQIWEGISEGRKKLLD